MNKVLRHVVHAKNIGQAFIEALALELALLVILTLTVPNVEESTWIALGVFVGVVGFFFARALTSKEVMRERPRTLPGKHPGDHRP